MPVQLPQEDFVRALATGRRGQFYSRIAPGEWIGLDNSDGQQRMVQGAFGEVIEAFVPFSGLTRVVSGVMDGVEWDGETLRRKPMDEYRKGRKTRKKLHEVRKGDDVA